MKNDENANVNKLRESFEQKIEEVKQVNPVQKLEYRQK